jgi:cation transport ATPase
MLLFFLLIGRFLDSRARGRARSAAGRLLALGGAPVTLIEPAGRIRSVRPAEVPVGGTVLVAVGERVGVDGAVSEGLSDLDVSLITGETMPARAGPGDRVFAGTLNLSAPLHVRVDAVGERTLLAEIVRMMEVAEQGRARMVALADRVARLYAPVVHALALSAFLGWWLVGGLAWQEALLIAAAVLIITCPCALALAVPVVQVIASGRLLKAGTFLKAATALERLTEADTVVFDKTGTLTLGRPTLETDAAEWTDDDLRRAAGGAASSRHPLARALAGACPAAPAVSGVREHPGEGLSWDDPEGPTRLGSAAFCGVAKPGVGGTLGTTSSGRHPALETPPNRPRSMGLSSSQSLADLARDRSSGSGMIRHCEPASIDAGEAIQGEKRDIRPGLLRRFAPRNDDQNKSCANPIDSTDEESERRTPAELPPQEMGRIGVGFLGPELWLRVGDRAPVRFRFADPLRPDAADVVDALKVRGLAVELLSGDRPETVARVAADAGIATWRGGCAPGDKLARLAALRDQGRRVLMVGDGLNDAPALAAAHVSASPASAIDISQTAADLVFQGDRLAPVVHALETAHRADRLVRQNLALALLYNAVTVPLALAGLVTPLIAAVAMSTSSLVVTTNAMRLTRTRKSRP